MPAKKKPVKKEEPEGDASSSSDSSSSSGEKAPAPKKKVAAKAKAKEEKAVKEEVSSSSDSESEKKPAPKKKVAAKAKPKEAKAAKEEVSSSSDSESDGGKKKPAPKKKVAAKAKPKEAKAAKEEGSSSSGSDSEGDGGNKKEDKPVEEKKVFEPPPRPVFTPHTAMAAITGPEEVVYCPVDGLPPDFCIHGPSWDKSKPWCLENYPQYYPELSGVSLVEAQQQADKASAKSKAKQLPGGKTKAEAAPSVYIKKMSRGGRKCVTSIGGLDSFGVSMEAAAKIFKKKFACGVSVVKGDHGLPDTVDIQGDFEDDVIDILLAEYKIPKSKVELVDGGTKKKGKS